MTTTISSNQPMNLDMPMEFPGIPKISDQEILRANEKFKNEALKNLSNLPLENQAKYISRLKGCLEMLQVENEWLIATMHSSEDIRIKISSLREQFSATLTRYHSQLGPYKEEVQKAQSRRQQVSEMIMFAQVDFPTFQKPTRTQERQTEVKRSPAEVRIDAAEKEWMLNAERISSDEAREGYARIVRLAVNELGQTEETHRRNNMQPDISDYFIQEKIIEGRRVVNQWYSTLTDTPNTAQPTSPDVRAKVYDAMVSRMDKESQTPSSQNQNRSADNSEFLFMVP